MPALRLILEPRIVFHYDLSCIIPNLKITKGINMIFAFWLIDRPGTAALRAEVRPVHRAYLAKLADRMAFCGPLLADDGQTPVGSLLAIDFPSRDEAEAWIQAEPFTMAGVYEKPMIHVFSNLWQQKVGFPPA